MIHILPVVTDEEEDGEDAVAAAALHQKNIKKKRYYTEGSKYPVKYHETYVLRNGFLLRKTHGTFCTL